MYKDPDDSERWRQSAWQAHLLNCWVMQYFTWLLWERLTHHAHLIELLMICSVSSRGFPCPWLSIRRELWCYFLWVMIGTQIHLSNFWELALLHRCTRHCLRASQKFRHSKVPKRFWEPHHASPERFSLKAQRPQVLHHWELLSIALHGYSMRRIHPQIMAHSKPWV